MILNWFLGSKRVVNCLTELWNCHGMLMLPSNSSSTHHLCSHSLVLTNAMMLESQNFDKNSPFCYRLSLNVSRDYTLHCYSGFHKEFIGISCDCRCGKLWFCGQLQYGPLLSYWGFSNLFSLRLSESAYLQPIIIIGLPKSKISIQAFCQTAMACWKCSLHP